MLTALYCTWTACLLHYTALYGLAYLGLTYLSFVWLALETLPSEEEVLTEMETNYMEYVGIEMVNITAHCTVLHGII